jgi:hypothetical protein
LVWRNRKKIIQIINAYLYLLLFLLLILWFDHCTELCKQKFIGDGLTDTTGFFVGAGISSDRLPLAKLNKCCKSATQREKDEGRKSLLELALELGCSIIWLWLRKLRE